MLRVRGLLRNRDLGALLAQSEPADLELRLDTGSVRVALSPDRTLDQWIKTLTASVEALSTPGRASGDCPARTVASGPQPKVPEPDNRPSDGEVSTAWHAVAIPRLLADAGLRSSGGYRRGLSAGQAQARLKADGPNEIHDITGRGALETLIDQFRSVPIALLGASTGLAMATRAYADAAAIGGVLAANAALGFTAERRAEQTVSSLRKLGPNRTTVLRDSRPMTIDSREVVVGDVLVLKPGEPVAADARVLQAHRLATNEAALTGESLPVRKEPSNAMPADTPLGERRNMVFMGTVISGGTGLAVVVATAERSALGRIRQLAQGTEAPRTQMQRELDRLGTRLAIGASAICAGVFMIGLLRGRPFMPLLRTAVSLAVAAIPEGLPTVATSLLASSIRSLQQRQVYARRLDAVENLGAVDTVCFDKTGTLTQNRMSVASVTVGLEQIETDEEHSLPSLPESWLRVAVLCNSIEPAEGPSAGTWQGSSTELALLAFAQRMGADADGLRRSHPPLAVRHRSEHHPYMVTLHESRERGLLVAVKGRPDEVLSRCETWYDGRSTVPLKPSHRRRLLQLNDQMSGRGERVLALAFRQHPDRDFGETAGLSWLGLVGLTDPLRQGLSQMVCRFKAAGIRPLMITGDQLGTAQAVATRIGLDGGRLLADAASLPESPAAIADLAERSSGFARTSPAMKLAIVRALQQRGHVVAMTGDGINDGPALKTADVGVAMGVTGTSFAHAMSDLVLRDDHPAAMLQAIEEGRTAFVNIKKSVRYLVSTNLSELATTTVAVAAGLPDPFDPLALLWTNVATDVWPAIALGLDPAEPGIMERAPVSLRGGLLDQREWAGLAADTGVMTLASLASFGYGLSRYGAGPKARTMAFMTLTSSQLLFALSMRSSQPILRSTLGPNPALRRAVGWSLVAQAGTVLLPFARRLLRTTPIGPADAIVVIATALAPLVVREWLKARATGGPMPIGSGP